MCRSKFIFQLAFLMLISSWSVGQNIQIKVFNKTGYDLDSVSFEHVYLGSIRKDSSVFLTNINEITMHGNVPLYRPNGSINNQKKPFNFKPCSTKSKKIKAGSYSFDLFIYETKNEFRLYWKKHE